MTLRTAVSGGVALAALIAVAGNARADFSGPYDPANIYFARYHSNGNQIYTDADGVFDTTHAPASVTIRGADNRIGGIGIAFISLDAAASGSVSFTYHYASEDAAGRDSFDFRIAGYIIFTQNTPSSGHLTFPVNAGDLIQFSVFSYDNFGGPGILTISDFTGPGQVAAVPEPGGVAFGIAAAGGVLGLVIRERKA